jgi:hypothetical protein
MNRIIELMEKRLKATKKALNLALRDDDLYPDGRLRISRSDTSYRYYHVKGENSESQRYIKKHERGMAVKLAQKTYREKFIKTATKEIECLENSIKKLSKYDADAAFVKEKIPRRELISPYFENDDLYALKWKSQTYKTNEFMQEHKTYETKQGEMVRSKSEAIIADILTELKIPYLYEKALKLKNGEIRYPDFTLLNKRTRKEIYLEHFGLLDDDNYLKSNLKKLDEYRRNGIYLGKNLIMTYEMQGSPLDIQGIKAMLKSILCDI